MDIFNNYFLIDSFGNAPTCSNNSDSGVRIIQTPINYPPNIVTPTTCRDNTNKISFPSTSCTNWCSDVTDYSTPKPASVWVFSAEKVNSS